MRVYIAASAFLLGLLAYLGLSVLGVVPQLAEREGNAPLEVVLVVISIFGLLHAAVIVAAAFWRDAPRRRWFWLVGALPPLIFFGEDLPKIPGLIAQPRGSQHIDRRRGCLVSRRAPDSWLKPIATADLLAARLENVRVGRVRC
jgi:hypothetical protein